MGSEAFVPVQEIARAAKEVPPEFVLADDDVRRTLRHRPEDADADDDLQIPVIDLRPLIDSSTDEELVARARGQIGRACEDSGFFQVINHGVPEPLLEKTLEVVEGFFNLPLEEKMAYALKPGKHEGYGLLAKTQVRGWGDAFRHVVRPRPAPAQDAQPKAPAAYKEVMEEYAAEVVKLGRRLTSALSEYLGLESTALETALTQEPGDYPGMAFALNFYPRCPQPDRVLGIHPHADAGAMTILHQNQVGGLQVLKGGKWLKVKPVKNSLVVNISDQLKILTNGRLRSAKHRATASSSSTRISIAAFCNPGSPEVVVGPLPQLVDEQHPPLYQEMQYSKYLSLLFSGSLWKSDLD